MSEARAIALTGDDLSIDQIIDIARNGAQVCLSDTVRTNLVSTRKFIVDLTPV